MRAEVAEQVAALNGRGKTVGLATVLVGDDPASHVYVRNKHRAAEKAGMISIDVNLPADVSQEEVIAAVHTLNGDDRVDGMIVQLPLPSGLDGNAAVEAVLPAKDADGLHPYNLGLLILDRPGPRPATPSGVLRILEHYGITTSGKRAVVIGRSFLVGRPMAIMLGAKGVDATVVQAHSRTPDLGAVTLEADIIVVAAGRPNLLRREHVKPGAIVIDVGTNRVDDKLVGDVDFEGVSSVAGGITPVPGGVGPMTIASLLVNTVQAAQRTATLD
ncbi:Methenyltetrahydrofolate cyclohydrolase / Methylenetetrahydrofolate dehydrogenase (NADP+) [hydrothermal vent metagenome]|uniref:Methenyltetrahydrofolate cyclohydrolase / Methylenetetrahydrofolate dehydrogenase (NADP+) n=1 Tax=hydrothermal vent metagenome TaxID=652676 RepID=A0A3B0T5S8_9ZZZZ